VPAAVDAKNAELQRALSQARQRGQQAEAKKQKAEKELAEFREEHARREQESKERLEALRQELETDRNQKLNAIEEKFAREVEAMRANLRRELVAEMAAEALEMTEARLRESPDKRAAYDGLALEHAAREMQEALKPA
jgi:F0F1-type ATP synthase membrane subunit b/b'